MTHEEFLMFQEKNKLTNRDLVEVLLYQEKQPAINLNKKKKIACVELVKDDGEFYLGMEDCFYQNWNDKEFYPVYFCPNDLLADVISITIIKRNIW